MDEFRFWKGGFWKDHLQVKGSGGDMRRVMHVDSIA
jgi:hypothetical protein